MVVMKKRKHFTFNNNVTDILKGQGQIRTRGTKAFPNKHMHPLLLSGENYVLNCTYCTGYRYNRSSRNVSL